MEKSNRPQRNRRHSRRAWPPEDDLRSSRVVKRLFTPEIKRMLKEWLIRRRDNPYPSRDEKKRLAIETGLTYTQICNWFANWRRKLKNSERERAKKSWGHLIKNYNNNAKGNVEQFSISSEDSIWEEEEGKSYELDMNMNMSMNMKSSDEDSSSGSYIEQNSGSADSVNSLYYKRPYQPNFYVENLEASAHKYQNDYNNEGYHTKESNFHSTNGLLDGFITKVPISSNSDYNTNDYIFAGSNKRKYKHKMMEKYLRDTSIEQQHSLKVPFMNPDSGSNVREALALSVNDKAEGKTLSKWLESAANFTPNKNSYYIDWTQQRSRLERKSHSQSSSQTLRSSTKDYSLMSDKSSDHADDLDQINIYDTIHHKDELDAAEALANLAFNCRQRMLQNSIYSKMNKISSK